MSDKQDNLDVLPSIRPAQDEVSSYRRGGRTDAPRQSNFNGILVFVILVMAIMMGVGGFTLYQVQKKLDQSNILLAKGQQNVQELDNRLAATGTDVSKTLQLMQGKIDTNFAEIDKLWGVAYRQNKPAISKNEKAIAALGSEIESKLLPLSEVVNSVSKKFTMLSRDMAEVKQGLIIDNEEMGTQVSIVRGQIQDQSVQLEGNQRQIAILSKQLKEAQEAINVIDKYRAQVNQRLIELRRLIQEPETSQTTSPE